MTAETVTSTPRASWFTRTTGWDGRRGQWTALGGMLLGAAGFAIIAKLAQNWSIGQTLLAIVAWLFVLGLIHRDAVQGLFGPVFFYDLLRVARNITTFVLRGFYAAAIGFLLTMMYFEWLQDRHARDSTITGELLLMIGFGVAVTTWLGLKSATIKSSSTVKVLFLLGAGILELIILGNALDCFVNPRSYYSINTTEQAFAANMPAGQIAKFANSFYETYTVIQFIVIALLTPVYVAGTIAVEKERKTLEFLFATDLRNREIIFGKLAARVLTLVFYVLAGLPLLAFLQLFGGIDPEQLLASTTAAVIFVIGISSIAIWVSTNLRKARDAIVLTYLITVTYLFVTYLLALFANAPWPFAGWWNTPVALFGYQCGVNDVVAFSAEGNPGWVLMRLIPGSSFYAGGGLPAVLRDYCVFWVFACSLLLFVSINRLRRVALAQAYGPSGKRGLFIHPKARGTDQRRQRSVRVNRPAIGDNPVFWKEVFVDSTFKGGWTGRIVSGIILALIILPLLTMTYFEFFDDIRMGFRGNQSFAAQWRRYQQQVNGWVRVCTGIVGLLLFVSAAMRGAGAISGEKDKDSWISLLATPIAAEEILIGKWWGCVLSLRRGYLVLLIIWGIGLALGAVHPIAIPIMLLLTAVYVSLFSWVGIYFSITARNTLVASVRGFFGAIFCAGGFWAVLAIFCFLPLAITNTRGETPDLIASFACGFTPPLVYGVFPIYELDHDELGPFDGERRRSAGLIGPIIGTLFWGVACLMLKVLCESKLRAITNREPQAPRAGPDDRMSSEDAN